MSSDSTHQRRPDVGAKVSENDTKDDEFHKKSHGCFVEGDNGNEIDSEESCDDPDDLIDGKEDSVNEVDEKELPPAKKLKKAVEPEDDKDDEDADDDKEDDDDDDDEEDLAGEDEGANGEDEDDDDDDDEEEEGEEDDID